jgi:hypothetical protein
MISELSERLEVVDGQEVVDVRQNRGHPPNSGLVAALS